MARNVIGKYSSRNVKLILLVLSKNPVHFNEYSHDFDDDVINDDIIDDDDKPACPYGTSCYR